MLRRKMKRLLLPVIAALALPTAVSAAEVYLLVFTISSAGTTSFVLPMKTLAGCEEAGVKILSSDKLHVGKYHTFRYECLEKK